MSLASRHCLGSCRDQDDAQEYLQESHRCYRHDQAAEPGSDDRTQGHGSRDPLDATTARKRVKAPVAEQSGGDQTKRDENAGRPGGSDISSENEHQRRDEKLATGHAQHAANEADAEPQCKPCDQMNNWVRRQETHLLKRESGLNQQEHADRPEQDCDDLHQLLCCQPLNQTRSIEGAEHAAADEPEHRGQVGAQVARRDDVTTGSKGERERNEADHQVERDSRPDIEPDRVHQDREAEFTTAQADEAAERTDRHAPAKGFLKKGQPNVRCMLAGSIARRMLLSGTAQGPDCISFHIDPMQYSKTFTDALQFVWGEGFLSPGGAEEVAALLQGEDLKDQRVLDIGSGAGGVDELLVTRHGAAEVVGIDVEPALVAEAAGRIAAKGLSDRIRFLTVDPDPALSRRQFRSRAVEGFDGPHRRQAGALRRSAAGAEAGRSVHRRRLAVGGRRGLEPRRRGLACRSAAEIRVHHAGGGGAGDARGRIRRRGRERSCAPVRPKSNRKEVEVLAGPAGERLARIAGAEMARQRLLSARGRQGALNSGDLKPSHLKGRKPGLR